MKTCKECGVILAGTMLIKHNNQSLLCKYCYKRYQAEQFKFWYDNKPKNEKVLRPCIICGTEFGSYQKKANVCSRKCTLEKKRRRERKNGRRL